MKSSRTMAGLELWDRESGKEFPALKTHKTKICLFSSVIEQA